MNTLSDDLILRALEFVPPSDLLQSASLVSKQFRQAVDNLWSVHSLLQPFFENDDDITWTPQMMQRICMYLYEERQRQQRDPSSASSILPSFDEITALHGRDRLACLASSTDNWNELIECARIPKPTDPVSNMIMNMILRNPSTWWSSLPSTPESCDTLLFSTRYPMSLVNEVRLSALRDPYTHGNTYAWKQTIIRAWRMELTTTSALSEASLPCSINGRSPNATSAGIRKPPQGQATMERILKNAKLVYQESFDDIDFQDGESHSLYLASPTVANVVTIELVGKHHEQSSGNGYYSCVEFLDVFGVPLKLEIS